MSQTILSCAVARSKPEKPYPDFPLTAHQLGYWCKKIRGKIHYFGPWSDPDGALAKYLAAKERLHAGEPAEAETVTVKRAINSFWTAKKRAAEAGQLSPRTLADYRAILLMLEKGLLKSRPVSSLRPDDFSRLKAKLAQKNGPARLSTIVQVIRCAFRHAAESFDLPPVRFGPDFRRTPKKVMRLHRAKQGLKLFTAREVRDLAAAADVQLKAMILLGINCGFGNTDCARLPMSAVDLAAGWIDYPRPKTAVARRCPLWPETVQALRDVLACRKAPKDKADADALFLTRCRRSWDAGSHSGASSLQVSRLLRKLGINGRKRLGFYTLRHTFRTVADAAKDQPAVDLIMGHESTHMSTAYREMIDDERLRAVADHVRRWLFPCPAQQTDRQAASLQTTALYCAGFVEDNRHE